MKSVRTGIVLATKRTNDNSKLRLGKGIAALLSEDVNSNSEPEFITGLKLTPIEALQPNPNNPRVNFDEENLETLSESIKSKGLLQPILIRPVGDHAGIFEIVAGERRWRAAQRAGLHEVPTIIQAISDHEALEIALIENVQRMDLNPLEEARGYSTLISSHQYTQEEVAKIVGKSRSHIANTLRLLSLPEHSRFLVTSGQLSAGQARALISTEDPDGLADKIIDEGLTVREVERLTSSQKKRSNLRENPTKNANLVDQLALEQRLGAELGTKVAIRTRDQRGEVLISFGSFEQLEFIVHRLLNET